MSREAETIAQWQGQSAEVRAVRKSAEIILFGGISEWVLGGENPSISVDQGWLRLMTDREVVEIGRGGGFAVVGCAPGQPTEIAEAPAFAGARAGGGVGLGSGPKLRLAWLLKELYLGALDLTLAPIRILLNLDTSPLKAHIRQEPLEIRRCSSRPNPPRTRPR